VRLYHFLKTCHAIDNVSKSRIKISLWKDVNDPWELLPFDLSDAEKRRALEGFKDRLNQMFSFVCLCRHWRSPLMWAHYAERHRGVALGFDVDDQFCNPIHYVADVYQLPSAYTGNIGNAILDDGRRMIDAALNTKFDAWQYEEEVRVFANQDGSNVEGGIEFYPYSRNFVLREIILGEKCDLSITQFRASVPNVDPTVSIIRARRAVHDFCLEPNPNAA
jgi:hypothetical protein